MNIHVVISPERKKTRSDAPGYLFVVSIGSSVTLHLDALLADSQSANDFSISLDVIPSQVIEQSAAFSNNLQQSAPGSMILLVAFEMLGQVSDPFAQNCNLNFRGSRVGWMDPVIGYDRAFSFLRQTHHLNPVSP
jgi:hypothetical protein